MQNYVRISKIKRLNKGTIETNYPLLCRYLRENIYKEYIEPIFYLSGNKEILLIYYDKPWSPHPDWTPVSEINGWVVENGFELDFNDMDKTEKRLADFYSSSISLTNLVQ
jgi:hypothetical protein